MRSPVSQSGLNEESIVIYDVPDAEIRAELNADRSSSRTKQRVKYSSSGKSPITGDRQPRDPATGRRKGIRGEAHHAAVALGLKTAPKWRKAA